VARIVLIDQLGCEIEDPGPPNPEQTFHQWRVSQVPLRLASLRCVPGRREP